MKKAARVELSLPPSRCAEVVAQGYRTVFEIGTGGMATVYIAAETGSSALRRTVALKIMHEHLSRNERFKKRFLDEARVLTHITHPYVCRVLGFGEEAGRPFMAMEYLVGEPLSRVLRALRRRVDGITNAERARLFARVIADVAEGLHGAHEATDARGRPLGVVHRDVSPQNLFLLYDGTVRILDFGIARYRDRQAETATNGTLTGKLPYMAPEQILGTSYDRRADLWALGVVFWELLTLTHLFRRESEARTLEAVCSAAIQTPTKLVEGLPAGLDEIVSRALQRDPELRYGTGRELARDLELWLSRTGRPVTHADVCEFLGEAFPGSYAERRRWAEMAAPEKGPTFVVTPPQPGEAAVQESAEVLVANRSAEVDAAKHSAEVLVANVSADVEGSPSRAPGIDFASEALALAVAPTANASGFVERRVRFEDEADDDYGDDDYGDDDYGDDEVELESLPEVIEQDEVTSLYRGPKLAPAVHPKTLESFNIAELSDEPAQAAQPVGVSTTGVDVPIPVTAVQLAVQPAVVATPRRTLVPWLALVGVGVVVGGGVLVGGMLGRTYLGVRAASEAPATSPSLAVATLDVTATVSPTNVSSQETLVQITGVPITGVPTTGVPSLTSESPPALVAPKAVPIKRSPVSESTPRAPAPSAPSAPSAPNLTSGDVLIVSTPAGLGVYMGERLLGKTPLKTRLPAGTAQLSVQLSAQGPRTPITAQVNPGQLNIVTLR